MNCAESTSSDGLKGALSIEGQASVNLTLIGTNSLTEKLGSSHFATVGIAEGAHLSISGKGTLSVRNETYGGAAIGSPGESAGGSLVIAGGTVDASVSTSYSGAAIGSGDSGSMKSISITGGAVTAQTGRGASAIGPGDRGTVAQLTISGGTINANPIGATKTVITGGTVNGVVQKAAAAAARSRAADDEASSGAVNEAGEALFPVTFSGLPAATPLSDMDFSIVNLDLVDDPQGGDDYGVRDVMTSDEGSLTFYLTPAEAYKRLVLASVGGKTYQGICEYAGEGDAFACALAPTDALLFYEGHTFEEGWLCEDAGLPWATDGASTESDDGCALTSVRFESPIDGLEVRYAVDNGSGFGEQVADGDIAGTMQKPIQALRVSLGGDAASGYKVLYRVYSPASGWSEWACDGAQARAGGDVSAVQAKLQPLEQAGGPVDDGQSADGSAAQTGDMPAALLVALSGAALAAVLAFVAHRRRKME